MSFEPSIDFGFRWFTVEYFNPSSKIEVTATLTLPGRQVKHEAKLCRSEYSTKDVEEYLEGIRGELADRMFDDVFLN